MSLEARLFLCDRLVFQHDSQRADLMAPSVTQTGLIALMLDLIHHGFYIEITAVRADHHDDSALGLHSHAYGYALDCWPLRSAKAGNYMDAQDPHFADFLEVAAASPWVYQIGLAGTAQTDANRAAAGQTAFGDDGADHIHFGAI